MICRVLPIRPIFGVKDNGPIRKEETLDLDEFKIRKCLLNGRVYDLDGESVTQKNVTEMIEKWHSNVQIEDDFYEDEMPEDPEVKEETPADDKEVAPETLVDVETAPVTVDVSTPKVSSTKKTNKK